ncbi:glycosyl hydrolase family 28 protein [Paenibacillus sp. Y412MC10]|uniref:glycosyl hydrolase family 28 protein n=1 Tax=Geobacillus sp. (strain Y412MC10) TaxID=481743 RepID=UPI0011AA626E|nr:glycosyl hydrolase family 28 protein [Paenibacillus sp. Y412MC10]
MTTTTHRLITYPAPSEAVGNPDFTVRIRQGQGEWQPLFSYNVKVDMHDVRNASMVYFDCSGPVEVEVTKNEGEVAEAVVRPLSAGIQCRRSGNRIIFTLDRPRKLSLEVNGDRFHNLHLFANPLEENVPDPADPHVLAVLPGKHNPDDLLRRMTAGVSVIYFEAGMHVLDEPLLRISSGVTVYIAGGAVVKGAIVCERVHDVTVRGRGMLYMSDFAKETYYRGVEIAFSHNIAVEGIITVDPPHYTILIGESEQISIRNVKTFSTRGWSDGIDMMSCSDVHIEDVFLRTSDDCIAIYGSRGDFYGDSRDVTVRNAVLWADVAHPIMIGVHGDHGHKGDTIERIVFENIDILEHHEPQEGYWGCLAINAGDHNTVRDVLFASIRVEPFELGRPIDIRVFQNPKYNPSPGSRVENIRFEDVAFDGDCGQPSVIEGFDPDRIVNGVLFRNVRINGRQMLDPESGNIVIGSHARHIEFE